MNGKRQADLGQRFQQLYLSRPLHGGESGCQRAWYEASQSAHNALRWLAAEQGTVYGGRTFLCWNPQGKEVYRADLPLLGSLGKPTVTPTDYRKELRHTLEGFQTNLPVQDADVVIASFDAATTGRLALTYYRELRESDFLQRLYDWDESCCWWAWNPETKRYNTNSTPVAAADRSVCLRPPARREGGYAWWWMTA